MSSGAPIHPPTEMMLLGTFHFQDEGRDRYKPKRQLEVNERQSEIHEVIERLAAFEPTKIAVEFDALQQSSVDQDYRAFLRDAFELSGSEHHQLGFRLAQRLGHEHVYAVNAWAVFTSRHETSTSRTLPGVKKRLSTRMRRSRTTPTSTTKPTC